ncbi:MAG: hypothetical protein E7158_01730 [Firmicutes bacterium]|nr:hypothetical protein [Bacillota bacterium]
MNDTYKLKQYFYKIINTVGSNEKNKVIDECKKECHNQVFIIDRIISIINGLETKESILSFINNVFDVEKDIINSELMDNIESQLENKTVNINRIEQKEVEVISYDTFEKKEEKQVCVPMTDNVILLDNQKKIITKVEDDDTRLYNNVIERLLGYSANSLLSLKDVSGNYLISNENLANTKKTELVKEDALCDPREVQYLIDRLMEGNTIRKDFLDRILIDLITNQNYRNTEDSFECLNSDLIENDYYVLNGVTIKKEYAFESLYRNYRDEIKDITDLIVDNYEQILNLIEDILNSTNCTNQIYFENLKINITRVYEKSKIEKGLDAIEFGTEVDIFDYERKKKNEDLSEKLLKLKKSLNLKELKLAKTGYANIFILVGGIVVFGIVFAYLIMLK